MWVLTLIRGEAPAGAARLARAARPLRRPRLRVLVPGRRPVPVASAAGRDVSDRRRHRPARAAAALVDRAPPVLALPALVFLFVLRRRARRGLVRRLVRRGRDRPDAERNARPDGVLLALPGTNVRVPGSAHQPLPGARRRQRLPVRGGMTMSEAVAHAGVSHHPIGLVVTDDLQRSRLTTFFRPILAIPHLILVSLWGIAVVLRLDHRVVRGALHGPRTAVAPRVHGRLAALRDARDGLRQPARESVPAVRGRRRVPVRRPRRRRRGAEPGDRSSSG